MNRSRAEDISGWMDGDDQGIRPSQLRSESDSMEKWERYHLIGALMRNECRDAGIHICKTDVASKISAQIENEPAWLLPAAKSHSTRRWMDSRVGGLTALAAAAGLAALAVVTLDGGFSTQPAAEAPVTAATTNVTRWQNTRPEHESDLNALLVEHGEFSTAAGLNGLVAYAKFVSYDNNR